MYSQRVPSRLGRITPAYAGKRKSGTGYQILCTDHPRLCGEKHEGGKSPCLVVGITPAYAGKRHSRQPLLCLSQDHPRLCGEKESVKQHPTEREGSPPPMRGKEKCLQFRAVPYRITPAYAGKSREDLKHGLAKKDHPRLCGEKYQIMDNIAHYSGSPPPMRGKDEYYHQLVNYIRITPAYAGKSSSM